MIGKSGTEVGGTYEENSEKHALCPVGKRVDGGEAGSAAQTAPSAGGSTLQSIPNRCGI